MKAWPTVPVHRDVERCIHLCTSEVGHLHMWTTEVVWSHYPHHLRTYHRITLAICDSHEASCSLYCLSSFDSTSPSSWEQVATPMQVDNYEGEKGPRNRMKEGRNTEYIHRGKLIE